LGGEENWLFGLCLCVGLWEGQSQMCQSGLAEFQFFLCDGKKFKHETVGCRVGKKSACWSVFVPVFLMYSGQVYGYRVGLYACL